MQHGIVLKYAEKENRKAGFPHWWAMLCFGILAIITSIISFRNPVETGITMSVMLGLGIISNGINRSVVLVGLNRFSKHLKELGENI